jgi:integrase/recombinase XerD
MLQDLQLAGLSERTQES